MAAGGVDEVLGLSLALCMALPAGHSAVFETIEVEKGYSQSLKAVQNRNLASDGESVCTAGCRAGSAFANGEFGFSSPSRYTAPKVSALGYDRAKIGRL